VVHKTGLTALRPAAPAVLMMGLSATAGSGDSVSSRGSACGLVLADVEGLPRAMLDSVRNRHSSLVYCCNLLWCGRRGKHRQSYVPPSWCLCAVFQST